jgi:hypothetical protein
MESLGVRERLHGAGDDISQRSRMTGEDSTDADTSSYNTASRFR